MDQDRLEQELALLLQRLDVDEELDRLAGHIQEIRRVIAANEPAGRRLDFLMQELNREANTLSSKSQDLETTRSRGRYEGPHRADAGAGAERGVKTAAL